MQEITIAICAAGGVLSLAVLGWLSSKEPFDKRKFAASVLTAIIAGVGVAATVNYTTSDISVIGCLLAFLTGVGADASRKAVTKNVSGTKIDPNDPCPCGSGKKYKHCCGK